MFMNMNTNMNGNKRKLLCARKSEQSPFTNIHN